MKKSTLCLFLIVGATVLIGFSDLLWAEPPGYSLTITFDADKDYFDWSEPVGVTVTLTNTSTERFWINKNLFFKTLYLEMQLIDPKGRVLLPQRNEEPESPDAGPLAFILNNNIPVQVTPCDFLDPGQSISSHTDDLRANYQTNLSGHYSARVDLSAMTFQEAIGTPEGDQCDFNNYQWLGVLKSDTKYLYAEGSTEVNIIPKYWLTLWKDGKYLIDDIAVTIWPEAGKTVDDYRTNYIQLNDVPAKRVLKMYSFLRKTYYLLAFFDKKKSINSLGPVVVGNWYPVVISGLLKTNQYFGGGHKVKIISVP